MHLSMPSARVTAAHRRPARVGARRLGILAAACAALATLMAAALPAIAQAEPPVSVEFMPGYVSPGTPESLNKVGVIKVGQPTASNVLVLEPGTSAAGAYFVPLAKWIAETRAGMAGVGGRAPREPARGPVRAQPCEGRQGERGRSLQLLPRLDHEPGDRTPPRAQPELGPIRKAVGDEGGGRRPAPRHRIGAQAGRSRRPRAATRSAVPS